MSYPSFFCASSLALLITSTVACGGPTPGDESGGTTASTGPADTTAPSTGEPTPTTTAGETGSDSGSGSATDSGTGSGSATDSGTGSADATDSGTGSADATTMNTDPPPGETDDTGPAETTTGGDDLVLDPATIEVFELPIGSIRYAVAGFDAAQQTCVAIIFSDPGDQQHCDDFEVGDTSGFPYVVVTPDAAPPCMQWDYAGNVQLDAAAGCMQLLEPFPPVITIDMQLSVSGAPFTGTISVASE